jgi:hypothetical protein
MQTLYTWEGEGEVYEPRAIRPRPRETVDPAARPGAGDDRPLVPGRHVPQPATGRRPRGEIKRLLVLEDLPKQVNFSGGPDLVSWLGQFTLNRVLGTVPVEEDGSAFFEIPAGRPVFFVALDENDLSVKRMHSFTTVMPGEVTRCVGMPRAADDDARSGRSARRRPQRAEANSDPAVRRVSGRAWTLPATSSRSWTSTASRVTAPRSARAACC